LVSQNFLSGILGGYEELSYEEIRRFEISGQGLEGTNFDKKKVKSLSNKKYSRKFEFIIKKLDRE